MNGFPGRYGFSGEFCSFMMPPTMIICWNSAIIRYTQFATCIQCRSRASRGPYSADANSLVFRSIMVADFRAAEE